MRFSNWDSEDTFCSSCLRRTSQTQHSRRPVQRTLYQMFCLFVHPNGKTEVCCCRAHSEETKEKRRLSAGMAGA